MKSILRNRRRPAKSATNSRTSREVFGDSLTKELLIPRFIDDYNYFMGGVDIADQLKSYYNTQRKHHKNWKPLWHFLLDIIITNCFKFHRHCPLSRRLPLPSTRYTYKEFRIKLAMQLFDYSERLPPKARGPIPAIPGPLTQYIVTNHAKKHRQIILYK